MTTKKIAAKLDQFEAKVSVIGEHADALEAFAHESPLDWVQRLRMIRETAESALRQAVPLAVDDGCTWEQVARALDVTRQSAHQRYSG